MFSKVWHENEEKNLIVGKFVIKVQPWVEDDMLDHIK